MSVDPLSHSLVKLSNDVYYTKPADAKLYYDADSIIHWNCLERMMFDASGFGFKHVDVGVKLAKLISSSYAHNLTKIQVVNV